MPSFCIAPKDINRSALEFIDTHILTYDDVIKAYHFPQKRNLKRITIPASTTPQLGGTIISLFKDVECLVFDFLAEPLDLRELKSLKYLYIKDYKTELDFELLPPSITVLRLGKYYEHEFSDNFLPFVDTILIDECNSCCAFELGWYRYTAVMSLKDLDLIDTDFINHFEHLNVLNVENCKYIKFDKIDTAFLKRLRSIRVVNGNKLDFSKFTKLKHLSLINCTLKSNSKHEVLPNTITHLFLENTEVVVGNDTDSRCLINNVLKSIKLSKADKASRLTEWIVVGMKSLRVLILDTDTANLFTPEGLSCLSRLKFLSLGDSTLDYSSLYNDLHGLNANNLTNWLFTILRNEKSYDEPCFSYVAKIPHITDHH